MASITVRNLDEELKARLRVRAAGHRHSVEEEVREILRTALAEPDDTSQDLAGRIRGRFQAVGGVELEIPKREPMREPPEFSP